MEREFEIQSTESTYLCKGRLYDVEVPGLCPLETLSGTLCEIKHATFIVPHYDTCIKLVSVIV